MIKARQTGHIEFLAVHLFAVSERCCASALTARSSTDSFLVLAVRLLVIVSIHGEITACSSIYLLSAYLPKQSQYFQVLSTCGLQKVILSE